MFSSPFLLVPVLHSPHTILNLIFSLSPIFYAPSFHTPISSLDEHQPSDWPSWRQSTIILSLSLVVHLGSCVNIYRWPIKVRREEKHRWFQDSWHIWRLSWDVTVISGKDFDLEWASRERKSIRDHNWDGKCFALGRKLWAMKIRSGNWLLAQGKSCHWNWSSYILNEIQNASETRLQ